MDTGQLHFTPVGSLGFVGEPVGTDSRLLVLLVFLSKPELSANFMMGSYLACSCTQKMGWGTYCSETSVKFLPN